uniref:Diacylglycerol glucosyltransferase N-terminal domain-containing protein n=1 Tax=Aegilops tauschii subsp. strangulata TaxID=200361 RepID=A0A453PYA7_AEGTS
MESSYKFMVRHVQLWKVAFHGTSPRWVHNFYLAALASFYAKYVVRIASPPLPPTDPSAIGFHEI